MYINTIFDKRKASSASEKRKSAVSQEKIQKALQHCVDIYEFLAYVVKKRAGRCMEDHDRDFLRELMEELSEIFNLMDKIDDDIRLRMMRPVALIPNETETIYPVELIAIDYIENKKR